MIPGRLAPRALFGPQPLSKVGITHGGGSTDLPARPPGSRPLFYGDFFITDLQIGVHVSFTLIKNVLWIKHSF